MSNTTYEDQEKFKTNYYSSSNYEKVDLDFLKYFNVEETLYTISESLNVYLMGLLSLDVFD